jgi:hypothetical protein
MCWLATSKEQTRFGFSLCMYEYIYYDANMVLVCMLDVLNCDLNLNFDSCMVDRDYVQAYRTRNHMMNNAYEVLVSGF